MEAPCKDCKDRKLLCHSKCELYKAFREYQDECNKARKAHNEFAGYKVNRKRRNKK